VVPSQWAKFGFDTWKHCRNMSPLPVIIAPHSGQNLPHFLSVLLIESWTYIPSLVLICESIAEISLHFLFGGIAAKLDWLSRATGFEYGSRKQCIYETWSDDHLRQVSWKSEKLCDLWCLLSVFDDIQYGGWIIYVDVTCWHVAA